MPTYTFEAAKLPEGVTCVDLETKWGLKRGEVASMTTQGGQIIVEILGDVLKGRGLARLTKALGG